MFEPIQISLSYSNDQAWRKVRQGRLWTLYLKFQHKAGALLTSMNNKKLKMKLKSTRKSYPNAKFKAISPFATTEYYWTYYRDQGSKNLDHIIASLKTTKQHHSSNKTDNLHKGLLEKLCIACNHRLKNVPDDGDGIFFYDNYNFSNSGHLCYIEETLDIFDAFFSGVKCYFFLDSSGILFPSAARLITSKYHFCEVIDASGFPICFPNEQSNHSDYLHRAQKITGDKYNVLFGSHFNALLSWKAPAVQHLYAKKPAWLNLYSKHESREIVFECLRKKELLKAKKQYIAIHSRNPSFLSANIRDSSPLENRDELFKGIEQSNLIVIVFGIYPVEKKYISDNVIYLCDLDPFDDSFQIHVLNGALAVIGSPSGITHMTYCTNTPLLLFDMPFPFCSALTGATWLALMKPLVRNERRLRLSEYYKIDMKAYAALENDGANPKSPLNYLSIELEHNSDERILAAFFELVADHYGLEALKRMQVIVPGNIKKINLQTSIQIDKEEIQELVDKFDNTGEYQAFSLNRLAEANWAVC